MQILRLVTFAGGSSIWARALRRLSKEAVKSGRFSSVHAYSPSDLATINPEFWKEHESFILGNKRGFGYWIWKPALVLHALRTLGSEESGVLYLDAGSALNLRSPEAVRRLEDYEQMSLETGGVFFRLSEGNSHRRYTRRAVLRSLGGLNLIDSTLLAGGVFVLSRGDKQEEFCEEWLSKVTINDYELVKDAPEKRGEDAEFVEHRHDQSVLSILAEGEKFTKLADETFFSPDWKTAGTSYPLWATRNKSGFRFAGDGFAGKLIRFFERLVFDNLDKRFKAATKP